MAVIRYADSWLEPERLGTYKPYRPTFEQSAKLGETHRRLLSAPLKPGSVAIDIGIPGSLRREDAAKLYELMYFGEGNALVLGAGQGLAAAISAQAIYDSGRRAMVVAVDANGWRLESARANLAALNLEENAEFVEAQPGAFSELGSSRGLKFGAVFVDHSTAYADVRSVCKHLPNLVADDGFVLFHDFNDRRNRDETKNRYGVYSGVLDALPVPPFSFFGVFGCTGVYRLLSRAAEEGHQDGVGVTSMISRN
jgi:predicted O-methyltransferase YrrM